MEIDTASVTRYLERALKGAEAVRVEKLERILGGASRATWTLDVSYRIDGRSVERGLILRCGTSAYGDVLGSPCALEYQVYRALAARTRLPVPKALWLEEDPAWLGTALFAMDRIDGCESAWAALSQPEYSGAAPRVARELFRLGGELTHFDWRGTDLESLLEPVAPEACWRRELDYWAGVIERCRREAQPIVRLAIDWLERHPPPPPRRVGLQSGDYRIGNFLFDREGSIRAWLDWEMAHLGDPLEDLAWACMPLWRGGAPEICGLLSEAEVISIWEEASGLEVDPDAYRWWKGLAQVKAQGIWQGAVRAFMDGTTGELSQAMIAVRISVLQDQETLREIGWSDESG